MSEPPNPDRIRRCELSDGDVTVAILNLGCITQDWRVPLHGDRVPVVLGYADPQEYLPNPYYMGVIAGRVANRVGNAAFDLNGRRVHLDANDGAHHLHGGGQGLGTRIWEMEPDGGRSVRLSHASPDGAMGYPGNVAFSVSIRLSGHCLSYDMVARTDRPTPVNLAQHSYYNLSGGGAVWDHVLHLDADRVTQTGADLIPTGQVLPVDGKPFDFRTPRSMDEADPDRRGLDMNFVLNSGGPGPQADLLAPNGLRLRMWTDQPGLQLFSAASLVERAAPLAGQTHVPFGAICLEPQSFPDAPNHPAFPSVIVTPDRPYRQRLAVEIAPKQEAAP